MRLPVLLLPVCLLVLLGVPASTTLPTPGEVWEQSARTAQFDAIPGDCSRPVDKLWIEKVESLKWVAYSSPNPNPAGGYYRPAADAITKDLLTLKKAGFTGLVTYASSGIMGKQFITIAQSLGYQGVIMGIWSPSGGDELENAAAASSNAIVLGYSIGNEGLGEPRARYSVPELCAAIAALRGRTGKPVSTSEDIEMYYRWPGLLSVGDWLFPISHPYWHSTKDASDAIQWEQEQYAALLDRTDRYVFFKEVGLPSAGAAGLSESNQDAYYRGLARTDVHFVYFEGFDQPSKSSSSVEPHWGIFNSDLSPKLLAWNMMGYRIFTGGPGSAASIEECPRKDPAACVQHPAGTLLLVGDERGNLQYRALLSFNTSALPDNAIITAVRLKVKSAGIVGTDPVNRRRSLIVDICTPPAEAPSAYPRVAFPDLTACWSSAGAFADASNSGWYTAELLPSALPSINVRGATRVRLLLSGPLVHDSPRAYIQFFSPSASEAETPLLLVKYRLP